MSTLRSQLSQIITEAGFSLWGVADIAGLHPLAKNYPKAVSIGLAYEIPFDDYDEEEYYKNTIRVRNEYDRKFANVVNRLNEENISHIIPGAPPHDPANNVPVFPHKLTATHAGLGWIGKSTLLITPDYGPRVRLGTILLADELDADTPVTESRCGTCNRCSEACPNDAIYNVLWQPGESEERLFSATNCRKRELYAEKIGRKHSCGHCLIVCPIGK